MIKPKTTARGLLSAPYAAPIGEPAVLVERMGPGGRMGRVMEWVKGHGTENDFVLLPDYDGDRCPDLTPAEIAALTDRRAGIGADGVIRVVRTAALGSDDAGESSEAEWFMDYRNADGSIAQMCGNGVRVFALYLAQAGLIDAGPVDRGHGDLGKTLAIGTRDGIKSVRFCPDGLISVDMGAPNLPAASIPIEVAAHGHSWPATEVDMGNPHAVAFVDDLEDVGRLLESPVVRPASAFGEGVNVEFFVDRGDRHVAMRVYERGVGETRSCGTGVCAVAAAAAAAAGVSTQAGTRYRVDVPGGRLDVVWTSTGSVELVGPAVIGVSGTVRG